MPHSLDTKKPTYQPKSIEQLYRPVSNTDKSTPWGLINNCSFTFSILQFVVPHFWWRILRPTSRKSTCNFTTNSSDTLFLGIHFQQQLCAFLLLKAEFTSRHSNPNTLIAVKTQEPTVTSTSSLFWYWKRLVKRLSFPFSFWRDCVFSCISISQPLVHEIPGQSYSQGREDSLSCLNWKPADNLS